MVVIERWGFRGQGDCRVAPRLSMSLWLRRPLVGLFYQGLPLLPRGWQWWGRKLFQHRRGRAKQMWFALLTQQNAKCMSALRSRWGAQLKPEVREKTVKGEYVEIFLLLPLEKLNLDRVKPDDSKKEDEEKLRYRLIPRTFSNWLQALSNYGECYRGKEFLNIVQRYFAIWTPWVRPTEYMGEWLGSCTMSSFGNAGMSVHHYAGIIRISASG